MIPKRKLIDVMLPLAAINVESLRRKTKAPKGWPTTFHKWWAQRPLAAARAVLFAQMVDDPSANPDLFPTSKLQDKERQRLMRLIEDLVLWDNTAQASVVRGVRDEIWQSWRRACAENADHPQAKTLFNRHQLPAFWDPFAGGGSLPLSAQWLGLAAHASDLNPVAVVINKALIDIPSRFAGRPPASLATKTDKPLIQGPWSGAQGLAEDVRFYAEVLQRDAETRIGAFYPTVKVTEALVRSRPDLKPLLARMLREARAARGRILPRRRR